MRIDSLLYLNETTPDGDVGTAVAEPVEEAAPAEPAAPETATPAEPAASTFDERWYRETAAEEADAIVRAQLGALLEQVGAEPDGPGQSGQFDWQQLDPFGDNYGQNLGQGIATTVQEAVAQALAPFQESIASAQAEQQRERGEQVATDMIHDAISAGDDLTDPGKQLVRPIADMLSAETIQRYGNTPRAGEAAIYQAVDLVRQLERAAAERGVNQQQNHLSTLASAGNAEPGVGGAAATVPGQPAKHMSTDELLNRHFTGA